MKEKYKTLDNLNRCYWNEFWSHLYTSWDQIHSPSSIGDSNVLGLNLDWHRFVTDRTIDFFENEIAPLRELTPNIPVTTNFMGGNPPDSHVFMTLTIKNLPNTLTSSAGIRIRTGQTATKQQKSLLRKLL